MEDSQGYQNGGPLNLCSRWRQRQIKRSIPNETAKG